jgi:hypothetical protein
MPEATRPTLLQSMIHASAVHAAVNNAQRRYAMTTAGVARGANPPRVDPATVDRRRAANKAARRSRRVNRRRAA